jgi:outer membrane protein, multidrug efflux system
MTDRNRSFGVALVTAFALIVLATLAAALAGCAVGPNYARPATSVAPQFAGTQQGPYSNADAQTRFWTQFNDPTLDELVDEALIANHDLRIALGHLVETRAERRGAKLDLLPTVTASGGYTDERLSAAESLFNEPIDARYYDAGFDAFWELDLFGRVRRNVEA